MWLLTRSVNEYNQHGEYFCAVWKNKPCDLEIVNWASNSSFHINELRAKKIINGEDRDYGFDWFDLVEIDYE